MPTTRVPLAAVIDGLRRWARGAYAEESAVELLVRSFGGRFCTTGYPWVRRCDRPGWYWLDGEPLIHATGALSGGEQRLLALAGALVSGLAITDLAGLMAGQDRTNQHLVLAALAHAGGSHEQVDSRVEAGRLLWRRVGPLVDWPPAEHLQVAS